MVAPAGVYYLVSSKRESSIIREHLGESVLNQSFPRKLSRLDKRGNPCYTVLTGKQTGKRFTVTVREMQQALVESGLAEDMDDAAHFLVDSGEITLEQHEAALSTKERERVYG
jgi:hypothetical protein